MAPACLLPGFSCCTQGRQEESQQNTQLCQRYCDQSCAGCGDSPVLDLQQVAHQAVTSTALHKIPLGRQEGFGVVIAVFLQEIIQQRQQGLLLDLVDGNSIHNRLNHAAVGRDDEDFVWLDPEGNTLLLPDGLQRDQGKLSAQGVREAPSGHGPR